MSSSTPSGSRCGGSLGYLAKEILGLYDRDDEYVFVTDGGHWENLGLVELLRRRCRRVICIDASGDRPGVVTGSIIYAKLMVSSDQPQHVRRFARSDPRFPNYSTGDQLLDDQQFAFLVEAGRAAGRVVAARFDGLSSPPTASGCVAGWIVRSARRHPVDTHWLGRLIRTHDPD